jgi:hypothetical protein
MMAAKSGPLLETLVADPSLKKYGLPTFPEQLCSIIKHFPLITH